MKFYNRIVFKASFFYIILIVLPITVLIGAMMFPYRSNLIEQVEAHNDLAAITFKSYVEREMSHVEDTTNSIVLAIEKTCINEEMKQEFIYQSAVESDIISQIFILDTSGAKVMSSSGELGNRSDREYYQIAMQGKSNFSNVIISRSTGTPITVYAVPIYIDSEIQGVLCSVVELDFISKVISENEINPKQEVYIIDNQGYLIAHSDKHTIDKLEDMSMKEPVKQLLNGNSGNRRIYYEGMEYLTSYIEFGSMGWGIVVDEPIKEAFSELYVMQKVIMIVSVIGLLIIFFGTVLGTIATRKPIITLENSIRQIIGGDLSVKLPNKLLIRKDELGVLAKLCEQMLASVNELLEKIEDSNIELNAVVESSEDVFFSYSIESNTFSLTKESKAILGIENNTSKDILALIKSHMSEEDFYELNELWNHILNGNLNSGKRNLAYNLNGEQYIFRFTVLSYTIHSRKQHHIVIAIKDITVEANQKMVLLDKLYKHPVTGLYNRNAMLEKIQGMLDKNKTIYFWIIDIYNFRYINGNFGFETGNEILNVVKEVLFTLKDRYVELGHLEGDHFCMIFEKEINIEEISALLNKRLNRIIYKKYEYLLNGCSGVAKNVNGDTAEKIMRKAEIALLKAKESDTQGYEFYSESYRTKLDERLGIMNHLKSAIENNEIFMVYQPIVDSLKNEIVGYETLARWQSPQYGFVPPNVFIEMAEDIGFISELGKFICEEAMKFSREINKYEDNLTVSINVSPKQLRGNEFIDMFINLLKKYELKSNLIAIEITESVYIENLNITKEIISNLREIGIKVYLDDFGTGYSSLSYIENLPIDVLKIDKSFVDKLEDVESSKMISVFKTLADHLKIKTIVEGVEYEYQLEILKELSCTYIQGYYYSKPLREEDIFEARNRK